MWLRCQGLVFSRCLSYTLTRLVLTFLLVKSGTHSAYSQSLLHAGVYKVYKWYFTSTQYSLQLFTWTAVMPNHIHQTLSTNVYTQLYKYSNCILFTFHSCLYLQSLSKGWCNVPRFDCHSNYCNFYWEKVYLFDSLQLSNRTFLVWQWPISSWNRSQTYNDIVVYDWVCFILSECFVLSSKVFATRRFTVSCTQRAAIFAEDEWVIIMGNPYIHIERRKCLVLRLFLIMHLANLHWFLIYVVSGLTLFGWFIDFCFFPFFYRRNIFFTPFWFTLTFSESN
jgi:hypothetical protein